MPDDLDGLDVEVLRLPVFEGSGASQGAARHLARRALRAHRHAARSGRGERPARDRERGRPRGASCTAPPARTAPASSWRSRCWPSASTAMRSSTTTRAPRRTSPASGSRRWSTLVGRYGVPDTPELRTLMGGSPREAIEGVLDDGRARARRRRASTCSRRGSTLGELAALETLLIDAELSARRAAPASAAARPLNRASTDASITSFAGANCGRPGATAHVGRGAHREHPLATAARAAPAAP